MVVDLKNSFPLFGWRVADRVRNSFADANEIGVKVCLGVGKLRDVQGGGQEGGYEAGVDESLSRSE
jgi:hypothetical protein